jgi:lipopolysaccharide transport system permease protein
MSIRYSGIRTEVQPGAGAVLLHCRIENRSKKAWVRADGFAVGWQIFDPRSGVFISEGEWQTLSEDVAAGGAAEVELRIELPAQRGEYRVYLSPVLGEAGWAYMKGWNLVAVDAAVTETGVSIERSRVTTLGALRRESLPRWLKSVFTGPLQTVLRNRHLIGSMVRRDIYGRYRGSVGDMFWAVLNPLLLMLTYAFVFGLVLNTRFANDTSPAGFVLYFLAGMMPWLPFSEALARAPQAVLEHRNFVKKLRFPIEIVPVTQVLAALITQAIALVFFIAGIIIARERVPITVLWLPVLLVPQVLLTLGLSWFLAALGAFLRDLGQIMGFLLTLWFFVTPICYPEQQLPAAALPVLGKNPVYILVRAYRAIFLENHPPEFAALWKLYAISIVVCLLGHACFQKLKKNFGDVV